MGFDEDLFGQLRLCLEQEGRKVALKRLDAQWQAEWLE